MRERKEPHMIGRVVWELETEDRAHAHETQERISQLFRLRLQQVLEAVLDECDLQGEVLRYERIELDLGELLMEELDSGIEHRLKAQLLNALKTSRMGLGDAARAKPPERVPLPEDRLVRLLAYLRTGLLSGPDPDSIPDLAASLLEQAPERLLAGLRQAGPPAAPRLSMQLPQPLQEQLLAALLGSAWAPVAAWAGRVLAVYRQSPLPGLAPAALYRLLLEALWAQALTAQPPARLSGWQQAVRAYWDQTRAPVAADARFAQLRARVLPPQTAADQQDTFEADPDLRAEEAAAAVSAGTAEAGGRSGAGPAAGAEQAVAALRYRLSHGRWPWWAPAADDQLPWLEHYGAAAARLIHAWLELPPPARLRIAQGIWRGGLPPAPARLLQAWIPDQAGLFVLARQALEAWALPGAQAWTAQRYDAAALSFVLIRGTQALEGSAWISRLLHLLAAALPQPAEELRQAWLSHLAGLEAQTGARWAVLRRMTPDAAGLRRAAAGATRDDQAAALPPAVPPLPEQPSDRLPGESGGGEEPDAVSGAGTALSEAAAWAALDAPAVPDSPAGVSFPMPEGIPFSAHPPADRRQVAQQLKQWIGSGALPPDAEELTEAQLFGSFQLLLRDATAAELRAWLRSPAAAERLMRAAGGLPGLRLAGRKLSPDPSPGWMEWMQALSRLLRTELLPGLSAAWLQQASLRLAAADPALDEGAWLKGVVKFAVRELRIHPLSLIQALAGRLRQSASRHREPMLALLRGMEQQARRVPAPEAQQPAKPPKPRLPDGTPVYIQNAGLVLAWPLLPFLFQTLEYVTPERKWRTEQAQQRAVHLLQYLVNKRTDLPEPLLPLNKLLCGLPLEAPVPASADLTERELELAEALLAQICKRWPPLKNSSNDGLRGSFLIREGRLSLEEEFWTLRVEQKSVDLLLASLPWALNRVKLPWMPSVLLVEWR